MKQLSTTMLRSAGLLAMVAILGTALLAGVNELTHGRIEAQQLRAVLLQLNEVLPARFYDNSLHEDWVEITDPVGFGHDEPVRVYRARMQGQPVAAVLNLVAPDGYNGEIRMLVGIFADGRISGVSIISHRETPGLGDPVERNRSDWALGFDGKSLQNPAERGWAVKRDGGDFDQFTGATITPRAVVRAVRRALLYFEQHKDEIFALPGTPV